jgi:hypothetical protein
LFGLVGAIALSIGARALGLELLLQRSGQGLDGLPNCRSMSCASNAARTFACS